MLLIILTSCVFAAYNNQPVQMGANQQFVQQAQPGMYQPQNMNTLQQPLVCKQILDPTFCKGPSAMQPGFICAWEKNECEAVDPSEAKNELVENACKSLTTNPAACRMKPGCMWREFECQADETKFSPEVGERPEAPEIGEAPERPEAPEMGEQPGLFPGFSNGMYTPQGGAMQPSGVQTPPAPMQPAGVQPPPVQPAGVQPAPVQPAGVQPTPGSVQPAAQSGSGISGSLVNPDSEAGAAPSTPQTQPLTPQTNSNPPPASQTPPSTPAPAPQATSNKPTTPQTNSNNPPSPQNNSPSPPSNPTRPSIPNRPVMPKFCKSLPQPECFGPAMKHGMVCMWDAEDGECMTASALDMEAVCKQFHRDPVKCNQHENCFWDQLDRECSEIELPPGLPAGNRPQVMSVCAESKTVESCAQQATCFWDRIASQGKGLCVNVVQASNVCRVLNTPHYCSTNALCQWVGNTCSPVRGLRAVHRPNSQYVQESSTWVRDISVGLGASVLGIMVGLFASWARSKCFHRQSSNEDYRDIMMDSNSQRIV